MYCPDFKIGDLYFEMKGDHFFKDKNPLREMICPYDRSLDEFYEAKHQCMLKNDIVIVTTSEYAMFQTYVDMQYGKGFCKKFKNA